MTLSQFLEGMARTETPAKLKAGIVFVALDRPVDRLIQLGLGLGPYHPGKESPWSHCFLLAEDYHGPTTTILDCTIRDPKTGGLMWEEPLPDLLREGITSCGAIYLGQVGDYNDPRVTARGLKLVRRLTEEKRSAILAEGYKLKQAGYHYDIPGLVRALAKLLTGISIPAGEKLLFCSAFCQAAYRAVSPPWDFAVGTATGDVTPDDLWYSKLGTRFP
jgi:hypothetical protein